MAEEKSCKLCKAGGKVKTFFKRDHTPLEKGLMVATGVFAGIVIGVALSPLKGGFALGSHNGCGNVWTPSKRKEQ